MLRLRDPAPALLLLRGACGFALLMLLNVSYDRFLTLADAFALFLGARACSSRSLSLSGSRSRGYETLTPPPSLSAPPGALTFLSVGLAAALLREPVSRAVLVGGAVTVGGVACITRPSWLFGGASAAGPAAHTAAQRAVGAGLVALAALFAATFNTLTRKLRDRSAAMLLSYLHAAAARGRG